MGVKADSGIIPNMQSLESLERETPEFQGLSQTQQEERRKLLSLVLDRVLTNPFSLGLSEEQAFKFTCDLLEFHLSGRIDKIPNAEPLRKRKR